MTSVSFHKHPFSLRLKKPLALKRRPLRSNDPLVYASEIMSATDKCRTGYGEVVYSEKLAQEMALLDLKSRQKGCSIPELLGRKIYHEQVPIAWMYPTCHPGLDPGSSAGPRVKPGVTAALKFKITHNYVQEAEYLTDIQKAVGPNMPIRLDANQKLSLKEAINFGKRIAHLNIAYFEEPLKDPSQIPQFVQATGIPVALDESLSTTYRCHPGLACPIGYDPGSSAGPRVIPYRAREPGVTGHSIDLPEGITTLALKPFMMPDFKTIFYWIDLANEQNLDIAICSCFESSLGLSWLVLLAAIASPKLLPAGLSTYSWFEENFFEPKFTIAESLGQIRNFQAS